LLAGVSTPLDGVRRGVWIDATPGGLVRGVFARRIALVLVAVLVLDRQRCK
jgi:hypothetical protein